MHAGAFITQARSGAGLTFQQMAERTEVPQAANEAYEAGLASPSFDVLKELLATCGYGFDGRVVPDPELRLSVSDHLLALTPEERLRWGMHSANTVLAAARLARKHS